MSTVKSVPFSNIHVKYADKVGCDVTSAAKKNRGFIRQNFETIVSHWPELKAARKVNRDSAPYPKTIPETVANAIVARDLGKLSKPKRARKPKVTSQDVIGPISDSAHHNN